MSGLGRRVPTDFEHMEKYPLMALPKVPKNVPVAIGVNWYTDFDTPHAKIRHKESANAAQWIGLDSKSLGSIRGGHCVCLLPAGLKDVLSWYHFYNQGQEGACVGFGCSRMMSLLNLEEYDAWWLWNYAKTVDEWKDTNPGDSNGTSVRAACDVLRTKGHIRYNGPKMEYEAHKDGVVRKSEGIAANRWATKVDEILHALGTPGWDHVRILNSWGTDYPHIVNMPAETLQRLLDEDGEASIVTDR